MRRGSRTPQASAEAYWYLPLHLHAAKPPTRPSRVRVETCTATVTKFATPEPDSLKKPNTACSVFSDCDLHR
jgi:hypothetical protein